MQFKPLVQLDSTRIGGKQFFPFIAFVVDGNCQGSIDGVVRVRDFLSGGCGDCDVLLEEIAEENPIFRIVAGVGVLGIRFDKPVRQRCLVAGFIFQVGLALDCDIGEICGVCRCLYGQIVFFRQRIVSNGDGILLRRVSLGCKAVIDVFPVFQDADGCLCHVRFLNEKPVVGFRRRQPHGIAQGVLYILVPGGIRESAQGDGAATVVGSVVDLIPIVPVYQGQLCIGGEHLVAVHCHHNRLVKVPQQVIAVVNGILPFFNGRAACFPIVVNIAQQHRNLVAMGGDDWGLHRFIGASAVERAGDGRRIEVVVQQLLHHDGDIELIGIVGIRGVFEGDGQQGKLIQGVVVFARRCVNCAVVHRYGRIRNCFKLRVLPLVGCCSDSAFQFPA